MVFAWYGRPHDPAPRVLSSRATGHPGVWTGVTLEAAREAADTALTARDMAPTWDPDATAAAFHHAAELARETTPGPVGPPLRP